MGTEARTIIARLKGGLGNQLFQYACALAVARHFGAEPAFDASILTPQDVIGRKLELGAIFGEKLRLATVAPELPAVRSEVPQTLFAEVAAQFSTGAPAVVLDGYFQDEAFFFTAAEEIKRDLIAFRQERLAGQGLPRTRNHAVALHLRRHDYQHLGLCADAYYLEAVRWFNHKYGGDVEFFVFSDEPLYTADLLRPLAAEAQLRMVNTGDHMLDFLLMSLCEHFVIANSTYSWWAAWLGEGMRSIVFAPHQPWILGSEADPCPPRWAKVAGVVARKDWPEEIKDKLRWARFSASYYQFQAASQPVAEKLTLRADPNQLFPCLEDEVENHPIEPHYLYHPAWAIRKLLHYGVQEHYDFGSTLHFATLASAICKITLHDFRPPHILLSNLECRACDLMQLEYADGSLPSISCMHTIEHIGLGRYGDTIDPLGDRRAAAELMRVLQPGGLLFFVVPVGMPRLQFNAHRIYSFAMVQELFAGLELLEHSLIPDNAVAVGMLDGAPPAIIDSQRHGCGCFVFRKPRLS